MNMYGKILELLEKQAIIGEKVIEIKEYEADNIALKVSIKVMLDKLSSFSDEIDTIEQSVTLLDETNNEADVLESLKELIKELHLNYHAFLKSFEIDEETK